MIDLTIRFATQEQVLAFATWLCEQGEQDYWMWAEIQTTHPMRKESPLHYVANFDYHNNGEGKDFMKDTVIRTRGVMVDENSGALFEGCCPVCQGHGIVGHGYPETRCELCKGSGLA